MNFIYNPVTNEKVNLFTVEGANLLENLLKSHLQSGGANTENKVCITPEPVNSTNKSISDVSSETEKTIDNSNPNELVDFINEMAQSKKNTLIHFPISEEVDNLLKQYTSNPKKYLEKVNEMPEDSHDTETITSIQSTTKDFDTQKGPSIEYELKRCDQFYTRLTSLNINKKQMIKKFMEQYHISYQVDLNKTFTDLNMFQKSSDKFYFRSYNDIARFVQTNTNTTITNYILDKLNDFDVEKERYLFDFLYERIRFNMIENILEFYMLIREKINDKIKYIKNTNQPSDYPTIFQQLRFILTGDQNVSNVFNNNYNKTNSQPTESDYKEMLQQQQQKQYTFNLFIEELGNNSYPVLANELRYVTDNGYIVTNFDELQDNELSVYYVLPKLMKQVSDPVFIEDMETQYDPNIELGINLTNKK